MRVWFTDQKSNPLDTKNEKKKQKQQHKFSIRYIKKRLALRVQQRDQIFVFCWKYG